MKLTHAYHCQSCQEIFERAPQGVCPVCNSGQIYSLAWQVKPAAEREAWLRRIHGRKPSLRVFPRRISRLAPPYPCLAEANTVEAEVA